MKYRYYMLDSSGTPVGTDDARVWGEWMEKARLDGELRVDQTKVGKYRVSTVFLGIDHSFGGDIPMIYETMVFPDDEWSDLYCERYPTREEAKYGHFQAVEWAILRGVEPCPPV